MEIKRAGTQPSAQGPDNWFVGRVRLDPLFVVRPPSRTAGTSVTFEPGARTNWHTHPLGQILIVTAGAGWVQREGIAAPTGHIATFDAPPNKRAVKPA